MERGDWQGALECTRSGILRLQTNFNPGAGNKPTFGNGLIIIVGSQPVLSIDSASGKLRVHGKPGDRLRIETTSGFDSANQQP